MDEKFQDRIDNYLLNRMDDAEKTEFLREVEQNEEKKEQLEFTQNVKDAIRSREEKLQALNQFQQRYEEERRTFACRYTGTEYAACCCTASEGVSTEPKRAKKKIWLWISGVAAVFVVGFYAITPMFIFEDAPYPNYNGSHEEQMRGGDDVFGSTPADSMVNDTIKFNIEKKVNADE